MAIQEWTLMKVVGPTADEVGRRFERWSRARKTDDPNSWSSTEWPRATWLAATRFLGRLDEHRWGPPVAYYSRHTDFWSHSGELAGFLPGAAPQIVNEEGYWWCYRLPDRGRLVRRAKSLASGDSYPETQWLAGRLIEAAKAYDWLWREAVVLIGRRSVTASPGDQELARLAATVPKWFRRSPAARDGISPAELKRNSSRINHQNPAPATTRRVTIK